MKKVFAIIILMAMMLNGIIIPAQAKSKQKTMMLEFVCANNEIVKCSVPYYSKWKVRKNTLGTDEIVFDSSKDDEITIRVLSKSDDPEVDIFLSGLSDKKNKKALMKYLEEDYGDLDVSPEFFSTMYKYKKDGNGRYMLLVDMTNLYAVIRALDDEHILVYSFEADDNEVSKTQKKRVVSYAKKTVINEIVKNDMEEEPLQEVQFDENCPISLPADEDWYIAMEGRGENRHDFLWNSRESYSGEALSWETTMECWFMEFMLDKEDMVACMDLINSRNDADFEKAFVYWDEILYPELRTATMIFDTSAKLIEDSTKIVGETSKGYRVIKGLFEGNDHIITVYLTYNKGKNILQACVLANGAGTRMKEDIEKYVEEAIINQRY